MKFMGGAETVSGSRFLVDTTDTRILVDCGLFQGLKRPRQMDWEPFGVPPSSIDAVVLTHAHLDHSGYLPRLAREGFQGPIWCTPGTAALAEILLGDAARIQEEDARVANKRGSSKHHPALALFTADDAGRALELLRPVPFETDIELSPTVTASFHRAGHIPGAASVHLRDPTASILFSGDLGRSDDPVMRPPAPAPAADHIVIESTYGNRLHPDEDPADALASVVTATVRRGGIALIPLSGHADADGLLDWLRRAPTAPAGVSVVHGEPAAAETLRRRIHLDLGWDCHVPALTSTITVARRPRAREPVAPGSRRAGGLA